MALELIAAGHSPKDVARELNRSLFTVRNQLYAAMRKLDVHSRYELIVILRPNHASVAVTEPEVFAYAI